MSIRSPRAMAAATTAALCLAATLALAGDTRAPECAALENSLGPAPDWYAARCLGGRAVTERPAAGFPGLVPGVDTALFKTIFPTPIGLKSAVLPTLAFSGLLPDSQPLYAFTVQSGTGRIYAIDNASRQLGTFTSSGLFAPIGTLDPDPGPSFTVTGLAFGGGGAHMVASDGSPAGSRLYRINPATAAITLVGTITNTPFVVDIAIGFFDQIYGHDIGADTLIRIDRTTAAPTVIGPTGMSANFAQGMMFDFTDGTLYGCAFVTAPALQGQLVRFDLATGAATVLAGPVPDEMECGVGRPHDACVAPPFGGIESAASGGTAACSVTVAWRPATPCPNTTVKYNVYRSTTPRTPPTAATLLRSCVTGLAYVDTTATPGTRYYYRVRAEDNTVSGDGHCNNGIQDDNPIELSATPTGPATGPTDDVEGGAGNWDTSGGSGPNPWTVVTTQFHSPTHSWFVADPATTSDQRLRTVVPVPVRIGGELSFWLAYDTESSVDGTVLEYSLDGGATWSDILQGQGAVPANPNRIVENGYDALLSAASQGPLAGRQAWSGSAAFRQVRVDLIDFARRQVSFRFRFGSNASGGGPGVWIDDVTFALASSCVNVPAQAAAPQALAVDTGGDGVFQPNETAVVAPTWRNTGQNAITLSGALTNHTGPAGATYTIPDATASYGTIVVGGSASCLAAGGNCYSVSATAATRPATHWDSTVVETVSPTGATKTWTLHVGDSFSDVPRASGFYRFIETILHKAVTGGCTGAAFCPSGATTRDQIAVFVLLAREPAGYTPPPCGAAPMFADVPVTSPFCKWIEELARRGGVGGCGSGNFCPAGPVTREQLAVILLRTHDPTLDPPACGATPMFADVPASSPFCRWIEELVRRGVVTGCGGGNYCPGNPVTREQMGVFLTVTFGLTLYGL